MLLTLTFLILTIIFGCATYIFEDKDFEALSILSFIIAFAAGITTVICIIMLIICNVNTSATIAGEQETYNSLMYQVEHFDELYHNSVTNDRRELINSITEWNKDVIKERISHKNPWVNWFHPIDYDQFELIELGSL